MGNEILLNLSSALVKSLFLIFQRSPSKGVFPSVWKVGQVSAIFKEGDKGNIEKYRPISLLCNISKVFGKNIFIKLYSIVQDKLIHAQYGFRQHRSTILQMIIFLNEIYNAKDTDDVHELCVFYLDFEKAFDKESHKILLQKLQNMSNGGNFLAILESYLIDRKQYVTIKINKA